MARAARSTRKPIEPKADPHPPHLNFSFREWLRQRTMLVTNPFAWTPLSVLHEDYLAFCAATGVPADYVHGKDAFSGMLRAHQDREPEPRQVRAALGLTYEIAFARKLLAPVRSAA